MTEIVPRASCDQHTWDAFAFAHGGWIWWTTDWLSYELAWGRSEDRSFGVYHAGRLCAIVPYLAIDGVPSYNGELGIMPLGLGWREAAKLKGLTGTFRGHPVRMSVEWNEQRGFSEPGWATRVIDTRQTEAVLRHDLRHSNRSLINRAADRYDLVTGPLAGQMLHDLYGLQAHVLPVIPAKAWQVLWRLVEKGWLSFYAAVERDTGRCDAAIGVLHHGDWSYYASGRSLVPNVNAYLHWQVLMHPPARHYEIGWHARPGDDAKAQNVAHHKMGLGGFDWWIPVWTL